MSIAYLRYACPLLATATVIASCGGPSATPPSPSDTPPSPSATPPSPLDHSLVSEFLISGDETVRVFAPTLQYEANPRHFDEITVSLSTAQKPGPVTSITRHLSAPLALAPDGRTFRRPVLIEVQSPALLDLPTAPSALLRESADANWVVIPSDNYDPASGTFRVSVSHFSDFDIGDVPFAISSVQIASEVAQGEETTFNAAPIFEGVHSATFDGQTATVHSDGTIIAPGTSAGIRHLTITAHDYDVWDQDVFVPPAQDDDQEEWATVAQQFAPTLLFSRHHTPSGDGGGCTTETLATDDRADVTFRPSDLGDILRESISLGWKLGPSSVTDTLNGSVAVGFLSSHSRTESIIKMEGSEDLLSLGPSQTANTVYWTKSKMWGNRTLVTYWAFYPWDPKSPDLENGRHSFDRESISLVFECVDGPASCAPSEVVFAGHVPGQKMYRIDENDPATVTAGWLGESLVVPWDKVERGMSPNSASVYVAYGSHANYPSKGIYFVDPNLAGLVSFDLLESEVLNPGSEIPPVMSIAGGSEAACGDDETLSPDTYTLKNIDFADLDSGDPAPKALVYSGFWVDSPLWFNGRFPPFLERHANPSEWVATSESLAEQHCPDGDCVLCPTMDPYQGCLGGSRVDCSNGHGELFPCEGGTCTDGECSSSPVPACVEGAPCSSTVDGMVCVPGGEFTMGSSSGLGNELPVHTPCLSPFLIMTTEVTQGEYGACVDAGACTPPETAEYCNWGEEGREDHPVNCVTHNQSDSYCTWAGLRLPSEAEWEKAARGTDERRYPWGDEPPNCSLAVYECANVGTDVVGSRPAGASPYGVWDMAGNVGEWVNDFYQDSYDPGEDVDPVGPSSGSEKVARGGSWGTDEVGMRTTTRGHAAPSAEGDNSGTGVRCASDGV